MIKNKKKKINSTLYRLTSPHAFSHTCKTDFDGNPSKEREEESSYRYVLVNLASVVEITASFTVLSGGQQKAGVPCMCHMSATSLHVPELETPSESTAGALKKTLRFLQSCQEYYTVMIKKNN